VKHGWNLVKNQSAALGKPACFYVNTDKPKIGSPVEAYNCIEAIGCGKNSELFIYNNEKALIHVNSKLSVGFDKAGELVLKNYEDHKPAYVINFHHDGTMFFDGYHEDCVVVDDDKKISPNFINEKTPVLASSEADQNIFKKENLLCNIF
jgi:hypothetical protein